ncbi:Disease resistance protein (CC-NBS-LRR class) family [Euphorbia peplus]|nr:Disease resistance protein (CC-NBS-LRR class) family [Euphorbia peplus]
MNVNLSIGELLSCLWTCTTEHGGYICFQEKLETLKSETGKLQRLRDQLKRRMETAERENELLHKLEFWLSNIEPVETEVVQLANVGGQELENNCFGSCFPKNCWSRYKIGKKVDTQLVNVNNLTIEGQELLDAPIERTEDRIWKCLGREAGSIIGIHGKGGVGKTAVLSEVSNNLNNSNLDFDFVIPILVSQDINLEKIQATVGKEIGFLEDRWKEKTQDERATEILNILQQKKFLLLLDDIWEKVDLTKIGVPLPNTENNSSVVFTTRLEEVCNEMGADEKIEVLGLTKKKALQLFREKVGQQTLDIHPDIPRLAETVAGMCNGLPLVLITVGRAMTSKKTLREWHVAVDVLKRSISDVSGTKDPVYALLKFSYDSLSSEKVKCCFLYCSLFPEDFSINKFNLIDYWVGEGFLGEKDGVQDEGYNIISILTDACLLEDEGKDVKMHDLVREVVLWIASECGKFKDKYLVEAGAKLSEAPEIGRWERVRRMSLMANHIQNLTTAPRCSELLTLLLGNNHLKMFANSFFQFMPSLKVVDLSENRELTELPSGISNVGSLQYLNLSKTGIRQLPVELKKLVNLKCLNLEYTYELRTIPLQLISCFSNLIVLRMVHCASSDRVIGDGIRIGGHESLVRDLQHLQHLNVLTITIRHPNMLETLTSFDKFQLCTKALSLHHFKHSRLLNISFLEDMRSLADLEVVDCLNLTEVCIDESLITREGRFNSLRKVSIVNCSKLTDLTWVTLAPNLEFLNVSRCSSMEKMICQGKLSGKSPNVLTKIEALRLVSLPKLKSIYPLTLPFQCLKEIIVDECRNLRKLPLNSNSARKNRIVIQGWEDWWKNLEWEDEATRSIFLHSFKSCMY